LARQTYDCIGLYCQGQRAPITIITIITDNVVSPPLLKLLGRAGLDRSACGLASWLFVNESDAFTFTYLFVRHAQPDGDRQRTDRRINVIVIEDLGA